MRTHWRNLPALGIGIAMVTVGVVGASAYGPSANPGSIHSSRLVSLIDDASDLLESIAGEKQVPSGTIDDGDELLPQARITLAEAIAIAQSAESGELGEVDLETFKGRLAFNIEVGDRDIKVDAVDGTVLSSTGDRIRFCVHWLACS